MPGRPTRPTVLRSARPALAAAAVLLLWGAGAWAQTVAEAQQVPIFLKLLTYDRTLGGQTGALKIAVLTGDDDESRRNGEAFLAALREKSDKTVNGRPFEAAALAWSDEAALAAALSRGKIDILYVSRGLSEALPGVIRCTRETGVLTLAGDGGDVRRGLSIGLTLNDDRPRIIVNLEALVGEGHDLESRALRLCEVVNGS